MRRTGHHAMSSSSSPSRLSFVCLMQKKGAPCSSMPTYVGEETPYPPFLPPAHVVKYMPHLCMLPWSGLHPHPTYMHSCFFLSNKGCSQAWHLPTTNGAPHDKRIEGRKAMPEPRSHKAASRQLQGIREGCC